MVKLSLLLIILCLLTLEVYSDDVKEAKVRTKGKEISSSEVSDYYTTWKNNHQDIVKNVKSDEKAYRDLVFADNVKKIHQHNSDDSRTYDIGLNQFSLLTEPEFAQLMLTATPNPTYASDNSQKGNGRNLQIVGVTAIAASINWTALGKVTAVKNQGQCGSCWAFSATGALEASYLVKLGSKYTYSFAEQQLVDCSSSYGNYGCNGGWPASAFAYIKAKKITVTSRYAYVAKNQACKRTSSMPAYALTSYSSFSGCTNLQTQVNIRPVSVALDASNWSRYSSGIFTCTTSSINHAVLLVGYQTDGVWIIKNSWGTGWGERGYIRLPSGNSCGICNYPATVVA